jgi:hypothetical protein
VFDAAHVPPVTFAALLTLSRREVGCAHGNPIGPFWQSLMVILAHALQLTSRGLQPEGWRVIGTSVTRSATVYANVFDWRRELRDCSKVAGRSRRRRHQFSRPDSAGFTSTTRANERSGNWGLPRRCLGVTRGSKVKDQVLMMTRGSRNVSWQRIISRGHLPSFFVCEGVPTIARAWPCWV